MTALWQHKLCPAVPVWQERLTGSIAHPTSVPQTDHPQRSQLSRSEEKMGNSLGELRIPLMLRFFKRPCKEASPKTSHGWRRLAPQKNRGPAKCLASPLNCLQDMVTPAGFEPAAPGLGILCSILLSYGATRLVGGGRWRCLVAFAAGPGQALRPAPSALPGIARRESRLSYISLARRVKRLPANRCFPRAIQLL